MSDPNTPPKPSLVDRGHTVAKAALSAIPLVGGPAAELFNAIVTPPIERRRDEWFASIGQRLVELESAKVLDPNDLANNAAFVTTATKATRAAIANHEAEKLEALRNAVLNAALPHPPDESLQQMFIRLVDDLSVWHLRMLKLFQDPPAWFAVNGKRPPDAGLSSNLEDTILAAFAELKGRRDFCDLLATDLVSRGLANGLGLQVGMSSTGWRSRRTTTLGDQFLKFIESPPPLSAKAK